MFALQQLEALVGYGSGCSEYMAFWENTLDKYMTLYDECRGKLHVDSSAQTR